MKIRVVDTVGELKEVFDLERDGVILESDLNVIANECDLHERKHRDAEVLCTLAANSYGACLDLGTSYGRSAFKLATNLGDRGTVFTVNILPEQYDASGGQLITHLLTREEIGSYYRAHQLKNIQQIYANTAIWAVPTEIQDLAVVFVDAAHDADRVYEDTKNIYERIRPGGFICWHDFSPDRRAKYDWIDSVMRGVERFLAEAVPDAEILHLRHSWTGVLRKPGAASRSRLRVGLVLNREFHDKGRWTNVTTPHLVNGLLDRFDCCWIQNQGDYEELLGEVQVLLSLEAGWGAPALALTRTPALRQKLQSVVSYMFYSDPHGQKWREEYVLGGFDFLLGFYDAPTRYHFRRLPLERLVHFPWAVPDAWIGCGAVACVGPTNLTVFGAAAHEAYSVRNWCRSFPFVESCTNSGCENKAMTDAEYVRWVAGKSAIIAAGSDDPRYRLTTPKYFEIAALGSLLFAQETDDLAPLGFRHGENCVVFNRSNFEALARDYLRSPESYLGIRRQGRELIRRRHVLSVRLSFLENHFRENIENKLAHRSATRKPAQVRHRAVGAFLADEQPPESGAQPATSPAATFAPSVGAPRPTGYPEITPASLEPDFTPRAVEQTEAGTIVTLGQLRLCLQPARYLDRELIEGRLFEPASIKLLARLIRPGQTVVDVGANFGYYTLLLSRWVGPAGHVIAFEPTREYGQRLQAHLHDNGLETVRFEPIALSDHDHTTEIQIGECSATMHWTASSQPRATETVRLVRFDDWWTHAVALGQADQLDFLKIDVDGHELQALRGARETLSRHRPVLLIEFSKPNLEQAGSTSAELADFLERELGYVLHREEDGQPFGNRESLLSVVDRPDLSANVLCLPTLHPLADDLAGEFSRWFTPMCVPEVLAEAKKLPLAWQGKPLAWEVCHEILAFERFSNGRYSAQRLIELSNRRYQLLDALWPDGNPSQQQIEEFYQRSAEVLPWGHGVFQADHQIEERRRNWLRRLRLLQLLKDFGALSVLDYGAGGGHTSLLALTMGFERVVHHEYGVYHPSVNWRAAIIQETIPVAARCRFLATDAAAPLALAEPVDAIICTEVAEHVCSPDTMLEEIRKALKPGGLLVWVSYFGEGISCHLHPELRGQELALLRRHGFVPLGKLPVEYDGYSGLFCSCSASAGAAASARPLAELAAPDTSGAERTPPHGATAALFTKETDLYLASADRMDRVLANLRELRQISGAEVDTYATVVGGLSGLNYLLALRPRRLVFYDLNPTALSYARLVVEMIALASSPQDFISRVFARSVKRFLTTTGESELTAASQKRYLAQPVEPALLADTLTRLSADGRRIYQTFLAPHLTAPLLNGVRNCRQLLPCWPPDQRVPVGGGAAFGYDEAGQLVPNTNTFFYGLGWLESPATFAQVQQALALASLRFVTFDLMRGDLTELGVLSGSLVLHVSNIDDWFPNGWPPLLRDWEAQSLKAQCQLNVITSHNGLHRLNAAPHAWAYAALVPHVFGSIVEVTHKVPWGFHEFARTNVDVSQYLEAVFSADTTILHILLGEGIGRQQFLAVYHKALSQSRRVIVLEHNRESADWAKDPPVHFATEAELRCWLLDELSATAPQLAYFQRLTGEKDGQRNLLLVLDTNVVPPQTTPAQPPQAALPAPAKTHATTDRAACSVGSRASTANTRFRILLIADVPNWIFARHCKMLQLFLSDRFQFTIKIMGDSYREDDYDLIYPLEWNLIPRDQIKTPAKYVTGIRSHLSWKDEEFLSFADFLAAKFQRVHVVSKRLEKMFQPFLPGVVRITHGVETEVFTPRTRADQSGRGRARIGWAGNRINATKGFEQYVAPLARLPGVELAFCGYQDRNLNLEDMHKFYDSIDVYVCASSLHHEGNNNSLMEAASMQRAIITTDSGAVPEYLRHNENALIVERELPNFIRAVVELRDDPARRVALGEQARVSVQQHFEWRAMAEQYAAFFEHALVDQHSWQPDLQASRRAVALPEAVSAPPLAADPALAALTALLDRATVSAAQGHKVLAELLLDEALENFPDNVGALELQRELQSNGTIKRRLASGPPTTPRRKEAPARSGATNRPAVAPPSKPAEDAPLPETPDALRSAAVLFWSQGNWAEAAKRYEKLTRQHPDDLEVWRRRWACYRRQGHMVLADLILEEALTTHPEWAGVLSGLSTDDMTNPPQAGL